MIPIRLEGQALGTLRYGMSTEFLAAARARLISQGLLIGALGLIGSLAVLAAIGRFLTRNLTRLTTASAEIASGNYAVQLPVTTRDELGAVASAYGGTGLGLTIARRLVELMGGAIGVHSAPGEGSTFWFTARLGACAPAAAQPPGEGARVPARTDPPAPAATVAPPTRPLRGRVLVVEDNRLNRELAAEMLSHLGCEADVAVNGLEGVEAVARRRYDLVLMDCQMPELDGFAATRAIRRQEQEAGGHVTIVALTAHALASDRQRCLAAGMDDFLAKPLTIDGLRTALARWLPGQPRPPVEDAPARFARATPSSSNLPV